MSYRWIPTHQARFGRGRTFFPFPPWTGADCRNIQLKTKGMLGYFTKEIQNVLLTSELIPCIIKNKGIHIVQFQCLNNQLLIQIIIFKSNFWRSSTSAPPFTRFLHCKLHLHMREIFLATSQSERLFIGQKMYFSIIYISCIYHSVGLFLFDSW